MVSMMATFAVLSGVRSLRVPSVVITTRFIVSIAVTVPSVLSWGVAIVWAIILMAPLIRAMTISVLFLAVALIGTSVSITTARGPGLGFLIGLLFAVHVLGVFTTAHVSVMATFKELLKFEHVGFDHSMLPCVFYGVSLWVSKEHLFTKLALNGHFHAMAEVALFHVVQNLNPAVEEIFEPHVSRLASQV
jgi:hypothetical protein